MMKSERRRTRWAFAAAISAVGAATVMTIGAERAAAQQTTPGGGSMRSATVIVQCVYYSAGPSSPFRTEVKGVEVSGRSDPGIETGGLCSDVVSRLASLGLVIVHSTSVSGDFNGDGTVEAADYVVWRKSF